MVRVYAAALNIEDFYVVNGWAAGYNFWKLNPVEALNKAWSRTRGRPTNLKSESNHGGYTEKEPDQILQVFKLSHFRFQFYDRKRNRNIFIGLIRLNNFL